MAWAYFVVTNDEGVEFDSDDFPPWWVLLLIALVVTFVIFGIPAKIVGWW